MTIGEKIKKLRKEMGLTQDELAIYAHTKKQTIHKYEVGIVQNIPASKIKLLAERLNTTPAYLMGWEDEPDNTHSLENDPEIHVFHTYKKLDVEDKAEIRGEMKHMLKADKYKEEEETDISKYFDIAAANGEITKSAKKKKENTL